MPLRLHPQVITADTPDGIVLLHGRTRRYWQLNTTGAFILNRLLEDVTPDRIAGELATRHNLDHCQVAHDLTVVLDRLRDADLIRQAP